MRGPSMPHEPGLFEGVLVPEHNQDRAVEKLWYRPESCHFDDVPPAAEAVRD